jgi:alanine dehydrogenase
MVLLLSNEDVDSVLSMPRALAVLEDMYLELGRGSAIFAPRIDLHSPTRAEVGEDLPGAHYLKTLVGTIPKLETAALRLSSDVVAWPSVNGVRRRVKIPAAPGDRWLGLVLLFSTTNGELLAIMQDGLMQRARVGATNAIAAKYLARVDLHTVGLIGAGWQATTQVTALCSVRPSIEQIKVFSPTRERRERFAEETSELVGVQMVAVESAEQAVSGVDMIVTATNSRVPFVDPSWLRPGMHLSCMQRDEATSGCFERADLVVLHTRVKEHNVSSTDLDDLEQRFGLELRSHGSEWEFDWSIYPDLAELLSGKAQGRTSPDQITMFVNSIGIGAQFAAIGNLIYYQARDRGLGRDLPIDWFVESVHP